MRGLARQAVEIAFAVQRGAAAEREGVTAEELQRAQSKVCSQIVLSGERAANRMFSVVGNWLARREYRTIRESLDKYQQVTTADLHRVLERFPPTVATTVAVGPLPTLAT